MLPGHICHLGAESPEVVVVGAAEVKVARSGGAEPKNRSVAVGHFCEGEEGFEGFGCEGGGKGGFLLSGKRGDGDDYGNGVVV